MTAVRAAGRSGARRHSRTFSPERAPTASRSGTDPCRNRVRCGKDAQHVPEKTSRRVPARHGLKAPTIAGAALCFLYVLHAGREFEIYNAVGGRCAVRRRSPCLGRSPWSGRRPPPPTPSPACAAASASSARAAWPPPRAPASAAPGGTTSTGPTLVGMRTGAASYFMSTLVMLIGADDRPVRGMALSGRAEPIGSSLLCAGRGCGLLARVPGWDTTTKHIPPSGR